MNYFIRCYTIVFLPQRYNFIKDWTFCSTYRYRRPGCKFTPLKTQYYKYTISTCRNTKRVNEIKGKCATTTRNVSTSALDINTNVAKDVLLYRYENSRFFRIVNIFALCQFGFWSYLSHFAFTSLKDAPVPKDSGDLPWWRRINFGENKYRNGLTALSFLIGYGILTGAWLFTLKSVRYLILRKGGEKLTFVVYTPLGHNRMITVDLNKVSSQASRENARVQLPIKVKDHRLHYILDMRGEFRNPKLFDYTAGLKRTWKT